MKALTLSELVMVQVSRWFNVVLTQSELMMVGAITTTYMHCWVYYDPGLVLIILFSHFT